MYYLITTNGPGRGEWAGEEGAMALLRGKLYSGFTLQEEREIRELNALGRVFTHEKSGARLLQLASDDDNKVFSVSFRTPPPDSTGMPHILEHSVLCGSKKFPSKEPFVELAKGSLKTFLNAFTFPDKTMYPVASRNAKDFHNLVDVYLDAVFHPNIYRRPEIFMQEGWHHELESAAGEIGYKGVVYNEMRGVYSTPEAVLFRKITDSLFPDTAYRHESGGDPDAIPDLTLERFLAFHSKYYHPSNGYFFLYGDAEILEFLEFLDREYLGEFERTEVDSVIGVQRPFGSLRELEAFYPISPEEEESERTYLGLSFVTGTATDPHLSMAMDVLEHLLLETPAAPLKNALLEARIGKDVFGQFDRSILQPIFSVVVKGSEEGRRTEFREVVYRVLERLAKGGIEKRLVEASINIKEFNLREADYRGFPKGLVYNIKCMDSWLYDASPFLHLEYEQALNKVKRALAGDDFELMISALLLENRHGSMVVVKPKKGLSEEKNRETAERLRVYKESLSGGEIGTIIRAMETLKERQSAPDRPEDLMAIPMLSLGDINPKPEELPIEVREEDGVKVLHHDLFTSGIAYLTLLFDTSSVTQEEIPYLSILASVLGEVSTERFHYADLSNEVNIHTGGISFDADVYSDKERDGEFYPKLVVKAKVLVKKLPELARILAEILARTRYDEKDRLREIVQEAKSRLEMGIYDQGHLVASQRLLSYFSPLGWYTERLSGLSFYKFISGIEKSFDSAANVIMATLGGLATRLFSRRGLIVSLTADGKDYGRFREAFPGVLEQLGEGEQRREKTHAQQPPASASSLANAGPSASTRYRWDLGSRNEGLLTPGKVQYVAKGFNFRKLGHDYTGALNVLKTVASMDYLWNRVRVQGGAYGCFARISRNGNMYFCSYRDPNLKETLDVYDEAEKYIRSFSTDKREMTKYVIGTISGLDAPLTPSMKGEIAAERYLSGTSREDVQRTRDEALGATLEDIRRCADLVGEVMRQNRFCVLGNDGTLRQNGELFGDLVPVF